MTTYALELPGVTLDGFTEVLAPLSALYAVNQDPAPSEEDVPLTAPVSLTILATEVGATVTLAATVITIGGVVAFTGEAFQTGFSGTVTVDAANRVSYVIQPAAPFASLSVVSVVVAAAASAGGPLATSWSFTVLDVSTPVVVAAVARALKIVRVSFDEPVQQVGVGAGDAFGRKYSRRIEQRFRSGAGDHEPCG